MIGFGPYTAKIAFSCNSERQTYQRGRELYLQGELSPPSGAGIFGIPMADRQTDLLSYGYWDALNEEISETFQEFAR